MMDKLLQKQLQRAQHKMKQISDEGRTERVFSGGLCVFEIATLQARNCGFEEEFKAASSLLRALTHITKVGKLAYGLQLPEGSQPHLAFHVSLVGKK
jgi:hypothetical protein